MGLSRVLAERVLHQVSQVRLLSMLVVEVAAQELLVAELQVLAVMVAVEPGVIPARERRVLQELVVEVAARLG